MLSWDIFWDLSSNLIISGCDSTLTVLGMSAVISSVAHYLGLSILAFIGMVQYVVQYPHVNKSTYSLHCTNCVVCVCVYGIYTKYTIAYNLHIAAMLILC